MNVAVLGAGRMGAWLARKLTADNVVAVHDVDRAKAAAVGGVATLSSVEDLAVFRPDILLNAVSLSETVPAFQGAAPRLGKDCLLADVASIKGDLPEYYASCGFRYASVHPMFGPTFADMEALKDENAVIIAESDEEGAGFFRNFFARLGVRIFEYTFAQHDRMMAYSLTAPFVASLVFATGVDETAVPGSTFSRHLKIARGLLAEDDQLLAEILFNPGSLPQLDKVTANLEYLKHVIRARDHDEAEKLFNRLRKNVR
jgi:prephenate dehydrogenase